MKRVSTILAMLLVAGVAFAATEGEGSHTVTMNVEATLTLTAPSDLSWGDLAPGDNESAAQVVNVKSTAPYDLKIKNANGSADSVALRPWKYDTAADTFFVAGPYITDTLQVRGGDIGTLQDITTTYTTCLNDAPATTDDGTNTSIYYGIHIGYGDTRLTGANQAYAMKITFFATQSI